MTPAALITWRKSLHLSQTKAAALLGISLRQYIRYERGNTEISKPVQLLIAQREMMK
jgi:transcriptional regulator with XRE-family HTH domain